MNNYIQIAADAARPHSRCILDLIEKARASLIGADFDRSMWPGFQRAIETIRDATDWITDAFVHRDSLEVTWGSPPEDSDSWITLDRTAVLQAIVGQELATYLP